MHYDVNKTKNKKKKSFDGCHMTNVKLHVNKYGSYCQYLEMIDSIIYSSAISPIIQNN